MCWICFLTVLNVSFTLQENFAIRLTGEDEEHEPVHDQDGPENWHVENLKPTAHKRDGDGAGGRVPELELGKPSNEGAEFLVLPRGKGSDRSVLHVVVESIVGGVELGLEESEEQIQKVDTEGISDYRLQLALVSSHRIR